ncbi:MAG: AAA family ATPase, partial [Candidatus Heimdallarchaeota archaeon]|nr:AAA family ATPase [Candidatus Heimdallarchaeota archaeon]
FFVEGGNSVGKSSLFDAIFYAFFYDPTSAKELGTKEDLIKRGKSETEVLVAFEIDNRYYLVQRKHSRKTSVQAYLMEIEKEAALEGRNRTIKKISEGVPDVEAKITSLFNITREKALNTLIVRQGLVQTLAEAKGAELRDIIYELFQLENYRDIAIEIVKIKKQKLENEKDKNIINRTSDNIQLEITETNDRITDIKLDIKKIDNVINSITISTGQFPEVKDLQVLNGLTQRIDTQTKNINRKVERLEDLANKNGMSFPFSDKELETKKTEFDERMTILQKEQEAKREEIEKIIAEKAGLERDFETFSNRKKSLEGISIDEGEKAHCEVCNQEIDDAKLEELLELSRKNIPILTKGIEKKSQYRSNFEKEIQQLMTDYQALLRDKKELENLTEDLSELKELEEMKDQILKEMKESLVAFKAKTLEELASNYNLSNFEELFDHVQDLERQLNTKKQAKKHQLNSVKERHEHIDSLVKQTEENKKKEKENERLNYELSLLQEAQNYVEKFIAEDIITNRMLANIQYATSGYIYSFTKGKYSELYLLPTRTKTLNMSIKDEDSGFIKSQNLLSGGDKAAIGLGLRIGISELLKRLRPMKNSPYQPPKMDILILDEPLGSLDEERRAKVIEGLIAEDKFSQIFLITHTNIRKRFRAPVISVSSSGKESKIVYHPSPTEIEEEAEE